MPRAVFNDLRAFEAVFAIARTQDGWEIRGTAVLAAACHENR
jgi:hypothetical protein